MGETTVRAATSDDVVAVRRIAERGWNAAYDELLSRETIDAALREWYGPENTRAAIERDEGAYFVAERDGRVVGYVSGGPGERSGTAVLAAIYVEPDCWGEGVGTALLERFETFCRRRDCETLRFRVLADNEVGARFYRARGFEVVEERETELFGESVTEYAFRGRID